MNDAGNKPGPLHCSAIANINEQVVSVGVFLLCLVYRHDGNHAVCFSHRVLKAFDKIPGHDRLFNC